MTGQFHHTCQILILIISTQEFLFTISTDQYKCRTVRTHPINRCILIDHHLKRTNTTHLTNIIMGYSLATKRCIHPHLIRIHIIRLQPSLIQTEQHSKITSSRMTRHHYLLRIAPIFCSMTERPGHSLCRIVKCLINRHLRQQTVIGTNHHVTLILQFLGNLLLASLNTTTMEPHDDRTVFCPLRIIHIQFQTFLGISIILCSIGYILYSLVCLCICHQPHQEQH